MRPLYNLDSYALSALKYSLDGYQRYQNDSEIVDYFQATINALIGPIEQINVWTLRRQINLEDERRVGTATVNIAGTELWSGLERLTAREKVCLRLIGEGKRADAIAKTLEITQHTVARYKTNIAQKLGLPGSRDLKFFAINNPKLLQ